MAFRFEIPQVTLLRVAAFVFDAITVAVLLILPATVLSYTLLTFGGSMRSITLVWWGSMLIVVLALLVRDAVRGRSYGKRLLGLRLLTSSGKPCGLLRSIVRNLPLLIPGWNLIELYMVLFTSRSLRTGDRIAGTSVAEE